MSTVVHFYTSNTAYPGFPWPHTSFNLLALKKNSLIKYLHSKYSVRKGSGSSYPSTKTASLGDDILSMTPKLTPTA